MVFPSHQRSGSLSSSESLEWAQKTLIGLLKGWSNAGSMEALVWRMMRLA